MIYRRRKNKVWSSFQHGFGRTLGAYSANLLLKNPLLFLLLVAAAVIIILLALILLSA